MSSDASAATPAERARAVLGFSRWWQVAAVAVMMGLVSPYQYVWSSIEGPLADSLGVSLPALGLVFTLFVVFQAGSQFPVGWWRDRFGPRRPTLLAGVLAGGGYVGIAHATSLWQLYLLYSLGAVGVGIVYTVSVNTALKWFPDRRGLTTGVGTMAFAGGSALFVPYVRGSASAGGYADVLLDMGLLIGAGVIVCALVLRDPPAGWLDDGGGNSSDRRPDGGERTEGSRTSSDERSQSDGGEPSEGRRASSSRRLDGGSPVDPRQYEWREVLRTWQFWLMYAMFVAVSGAGLMLTAKIVSFAEHLGLAAAVATASATLLPVAGGAGRLVLGDLSDRIDRERALAASFTLFGAGLFLVVWFARAGSELAFLGAVVLATFFWAPQYTLFPAVVGDYYGAAYSSVNYALLYSGKMWGGVFGGAVAGWLVAAAGWQPTFLVGGALAVAAGLAALLLRPPPARSASG